MVNSEPRDGLSVKMPEREHKKTKSFYLMESRTGPMLYTGITMKNVKTEWGR